MTRIASIATGLRKLGWSAFGMVLAMGLPCVQGHAQQRESGKAPDFAPALLASNPATSQGATAPTPVLTAERQRRIQQNYLRQPLTFQPNVGQTDNRVEFLSQGDGYSLFLTPADAVLSLHDAPVKTQKGKIKTGKTATLEMVAVGGNKAAAATGIGPQASHTNYLIGNDHDKWYSDVPNYARIKYASIYPGIDLTYYGNQSQLEYDFVVTPGADPRAIKLQLKGMQRLHLDPKGELLIDTAVGQVRLDQPVLYQEKADGSHASVQGKFVLASNEIHFKIGDYDKSKPLVIDPILAYSSYLGGSNEENYALGHLGNYVSGIAVDQNGAAYITGISLSTTNFPFVGTQGAVTPLVPNAVYGFVAKFSQTGDLVYSTFLGGSVFFPYTSYAAIPGGIAVDSIGNAYIAGYTTTRNFPTYSSAYQSTPYSNGYTGVMGFVTKLNAAGNLNAGVGTASAYSTYLYSDIYGAIANGGGPGSTNQAENGVGGYTYLTAIAVDANGSAYVTGGFDPFLAWSVFQSNNDDTYRNAMQTVPSNEDLDILENSCDVVNICTSRWNVYDVAYNAGVVELNPLGTGISYASYLGGQVNDVGTGIAVDSALNIYLTGYTDSANFPVAPTNGTAIQSAPAGTVRQAFVAKLNPFATAGAAQLVYSTYLGGTGGDVNGVTTGDEGHAIAVDKNHDAYVTGSTASSDFPINSTIPPLQSSLAGGSGDIDAFVVKLNPTGTSPLLFSTYLGGGSPDSGQGIAVDSQNNFYVTGYSYSMESNLAYPAFPTTAGSLPVLQGLGSALQSAAFLTEYDAAATSMIQSTLFASPTAEGSIAGTAIAVDSTGNAYITGETKATDMPTTSDAYQKTLNGTSDAFMAKIWPLSITDSDSILPAAVNFGDVPIGTTSAVHTVTLTSHELSGLNVVISNLAGANPGNFNLSDGCTGQVTGIGSCEDSVTFKPTNGGQYSADFTFTITDAQAMTQTITIPVTGNGAGLQVSPNPVNFIPTLVGIPTSFLVTLTNAGTSNIIIDSFSIPNTAFGIGSSSAGTTCLTPITLGGGVACTLILTYTPTTVGSVSSTLSINLTSGGNVFTQPVTIIGSAAGLVLSPSPALFPDAEVAGVPTSLHILATNSGSNPLTFTNFSIPAGSGFSLDGNESSCKVANPLAGGSSCVFKVFFAPDSAGETTSTLTVDTTVGGPWTVTLSGLATAPAALIQPTSLSFGNQLVGTSSLVAQTAVTNTGAATLTISSFSVPANSGYALAPLGAGTTCTQPVTLAAQTPTVDGGYCYIGVIFTPAATGLDSSTLTITDNSGGSAGATQTVALSGTGVVLAFNPSSLTFPNTAVGTPSASMSTTLTNTLSAPLTLTSISLPGNSGFTISASGTTCTVGMALPALTGSCTVSVVFTPGSVGAAAGQLSVVDSVSSTPLTVALSGTGIAAAATPIFSPVAGTYPSAQSVTISDATTGATIYYTTNGTAPTASSTPYTGAITVSSTETIEAIAVATGYNNSAVATATYTIETAAATPIFSPGAGTYPSAQSVTISDATTGATIYYTTNGTAPTASSTPYAGAITVSSTETIEAIAVATGYNNSTVATATYTIETAAATPIFSPVAGTYPSTQSVTISDATAGATIYYTTNGTAPTAISTPYAGAITVSSTETIEAIAVATGYNNSAVASATYTIQAAAAPQAVLTPSTLTFTGIQVGTTSATKTIVLSNPGNAPLSITSFTPPPTPSAFAESNNCGATVAAGAFCTFSYTFTPTGTTTVSIGLSVADNAANSPQAAIITGTGIAAAAPQAVLTPSTLTFTGTPVGATSAIQTIILSNPGNAPLSITSFTPPPTPSAFAESNNCGATLAAGAFCTFSYTFTPTGTATVSVGLSVADNAANSPQTATITGAGIATATAATPIFSPVAGTYPSAQSVTISDATTGATIYYTTNGTAPTASSTPYTGAISVSSTETIEAIAVATGHNNSAVATATYTIQAVAAPQVVLTPSTLTFTGTQVGATSATQTITLSNPGNAALSITGITFSGSSAFVESNNCGATLAAGAFCTFSYTFKPTGTAAVSGGLSVVDNAANSPQTASINGTGTAAPPTPDFTLSVADASATVLPGGTTTFNITGTPVNTSTFPATVTLTTSGLPTGATAIFSPSSIASGAGTSSLILTIQTPQTTARSQPAGSPRGGAASRLAPYALALLLLPFAGTLRRQRKRFGRMLTLLLLLGAGAAAVAGLSGCNSTSGFLGQAPQAYTVTVTGTMGTLSHSTAVTLNVK